MIRIAAALAAALVTLFTQKSPQAVSRVSLADRFPPPPGYTSEQDVESDGTRNFSTATGVRGHILRRFVQAGDDKAGVAQIAGYFADRIHEQGGSLFDDRLNNVNGQLDGRIPGDKPVWLHVDISDEGGVIDIVALEERTPTAREMPVEEFRVAGTWSAAPGIAAIAEKIAPLFQPYRGWDWRLVGEDPNRVRLVGLARSQACATCSIISDTHDVTVATFDIRAGRVAVDIPSRHGVGEVSLYQQQLIEKIMTARLTDLVR